MKFVLQPSLEHIALVKIAVSLWNQNNVRALIENLRVSQQSCWITVTDYDWTRIEENITEKVQQLSLPPLLKEKVLCFIKPIGSQVLEWVNFHCKSFDLPLNIPAEFCWTPQGTIDRKKTAEVLVKDDSLDRVTCYKLACIYCLEDDIHQFWNSMPENVSELHWNTYFPIFSFWSRIMKRRGLANAPISYKVEFGKYAHHNNKAAVEYFLQKLTPQEREESLVQTAKSVEDAEVLCFLLSEMSEEQQMEAFKNKPYIVLRCFLQWPWQSLFMEMANCLWDFLSKKDYDWLLSEIIDKVREGYKDSNYQKLFNEFWHKSPDALKRLIKNEIEEGLLLKSLCHIKDKENIRLILKDASIAARDKFIYSDRIHYLCQDCIFDDEWDFLEFFIRECFPSRNELLKFKEAFDKHIKLKSVVDKLARNQQKWDKLFLSSDDSLSEYEKRSADEGESSSSKRFRSLE